MTNFRPCLRNWFNSKEQNDIEREIILIMLDTLKNISCKSEYLLELQEEIEDRYGITIATQDLHKIAKWYPCYFAVSYWGMFVVISAKKFF